MFGGGLEAWNRTTVPALVEKFQKAIAGVTPKKAGVGEARRSARLL